MFSLGETLDANMGLLGTPGLRSLLRRYNLAVQGEWSTRNSLAPLLTKPLENMRLNSSVSLA